MQHPYYLGLHGRVPVVGVKYPLPSYSLSGGEDDLASSGYAINGQIFAGCPYKGALDIGKSTMERYR